jgi:anti-sigma regulatory factor (Ser/Thr protein kinase)/ActR/RegA family two-component response regulator
LTTANSIPTDGGLAGTRVSRVMVIGREAEFCGALESGLTKRNCVTDIAAGNADALCLLRRVPADVIITDPSTSVEEDLALLEQVRATRAEVKMIVLSPSFGPEDVIAALRARVFLCKSAPFDANEIAAHAAQTTAAADALQSIEILSARREWVSLRVNCHMLAAERLVSFLKELQSELPMPQREELMSAFNEILMNAMEHGAQFHPDKVVEVAAIRTVRAIIFRVRDPGRGFRWDGISHAAVSNPPDAPARHIEIREQQGMRPGGYGIQLARGIVDELIYNEIGNEVLLIKHVG